MKFSCHVNLFQNGMVDYGVKCHFQQYFSYIMAVSFIGGRNRSTQTKTTIKMGALLLEIQLSWRTGFDSHVHKPAKPCHILETVSDKDLDLHLHNVVLFLCSTIRWFIVLNNISVMIVVWCERYLFILLIINSVDLLTDNMRWMNYRTYQQSQNPHWPSNLSNSLQVFL